MNKTPVLPSWKARSQKVVFHPACTLESPGELLGTAEAGPHPQRSWFNWFWWGLGLQRPPLVSITQSGLRITPLEGGQDSKQ